MLACVFDGVGGCLVVCVSVWCVCAMLSLALALQAPSGYTTGELRLLGLAKPAIGTRDDVFVCRGLWKIALSVIDIFHLVFYYRCEGWRVCTVRSAVKPAARGRWWASHWPRWPGV